MCGAHGSRPNPKWKCFSKSSTPTAAISSSKTRWAAVCCIVLRCIAACCSLLQFVAVCGNTRREIWHRQGSVRAESGVMHHTSDVSAAYYNILPHTATQILQHTTTQSDILEQRSGVMLCVAMCCSILQCAEMHVRNFDTNGSDEL